MIAVPPPGEPLFDVVMPLHAAAGDMLDLLRAAASIHSFVANGSDALVGRFLVVHPRGHTALIGGLRQLSPKVELVAEETLFTPAELTAIRTGLGWRRQQFIKLCAGRISSAEVIMTLDADVVSLRRLERADVLYKRFVRMQRGKQNDHWVADSFAFFAVEPPAKLMSVTPAFLARAGLETVPALLDRPGQGWIHRLVDAERRGSRWTEYMIYHAANLQAGTWDERHVFVKANALHEGVWRSHRADAHRIETITANAPPFFVYQSVRRDFFAARDVLSGFGVPSANDLPAAVREQLGEALLMLGETRRLWRHDLEPEFGKWQARFFDFMQRRVAGRAAQTAGDRFEVLATLFFIAVSIVERENEGIALQRAVSRALKRMDAHWFMAEAIAEDETFAALIALIEGHAAAMPEGLLALLYGAEIPRRLLARLLLVCRLPPGTTADILLIRAKYGKTPPARAVSQALAALVDEGDWVGVLRLARAVARRIPPRSDWRDAVAASWEALGRPAAAARTRRRAGFDPGAETALED